MRVDAELPPLPRASRRAADIRRDVDAAAVAAPLPLRRRHAAEVATLLPITP
jgi:hypothetical protein